MESLPTARAGAIAMNRFGLGARADETPPGDPQRWLLDQFDRYEPLPAAWRGEPGAVAITTRFGEERQQRMADDTASSGTNVASDAGESVMPGSAASPQAAQRANSQAARQATNRAIRREGVEIYRNAVNARLTSALDTETPFVERLVHFWSNHFAVSVDKPALAGLAGSFEMEAIRPHVLGRFEDMLVAVEQHAAMQVFLDQVRSVGPDSRAALRADQRDPAHKRGLNENLAREIMELHTLGVRTGYTQADVTEFARAMTGWTVGGIGGGPAARFVADRPVGSFAFVPQVHQPGTRTIMGKAYGQDGEAQASAVLTDLSVHPATARHIATKLARHFAGDNPPPAMVARLEKAFLSSRGDLPTVYRALIASPEAWSAAPAKFKTPWEWSVSSYRALGVTEVPAKAIQGLLDQLGQPMWKPGQPIGYDDTAASWAAPDAVLRRVEAAQRFASKAPPSIDARALAPQLFPAALTPMTAQALSRAESPTQALALLLVSPEMMRR